MSAGGINSNRGIAGSEIERIAGAGAAGGAGDAPADTEAALPKYNLERMAASGQATMLATMARLLEAMDQASGPPAPGEVEAWLQNLPPGSEPGEADRAMLERLEKLPPDELVALLAGLSEDAFSRLSNVAFALGRFDAFEPALSDAGRQRETTRLRGLAEGSWDEFQKWFDSLDAEERQEFEARFGDGGDAIFGQEPELAAKLERRFEAAVATSQRQEVVDHFKGMSEDEIYKELVQTGLEKDGEAVIAEQLRHLSSSKAPGTWEKYVRALGRAMSEKRDGYNPVSEQVLATEVAKLEGRGSPAAKAEMVRLLYARHGGKPPHDLLQIIVKSDPAGVLGQLRGDTFGDEGMVEQVIRDITAPYAEKPEKVAEVLGAILGPFATEVARAAEAKPYDADKLGQAADNLGYTLACAANAINATAEHWIGKAERGADILKLLPEVIGKTLTTAGLPGPGKAIREMGGKLVDKLKDLDITDVKAWQAAYKQGLWDIVNAMYRAEIPARTPNDPQKEVADARQSTADSRLRQSFNETYREPKPPK